MSPNLRSLYLLFIGWLLLTLPALSQTKIFFVTQTGAGPETGLNWESAYSGTKLQIAIDAASDYWKAHPDQSVEVWVAQGIYKPTTTTIRNAFFSMRDHVAIYGGFAGTELQLNQRPPITLSTPSSSTLSGEIGEPGDADNTYIIIRNVKPSDEDGLGWSAVLDGFIIADANGAGSGGGAIDNLDCSPTIRNCSFWGNRSGTGGAVLNRGENENTSPRFINCSFIGNVAKAIGTSIGGAVANFAISPGECNPSFVNCLFLGNSAEYKGGALSSGSNTKLELINCTFVNNSAPENGGIFHTNPGSVPTTKATNCLFWNNGGSQTFNLGPQDAPTVTANYSLFEPSVKGYDGDHYVTTSVSPFASETDLQLRPCSPAIDAGDPTSTTTTSGQTDLAGNPRFYDNRVDIGAFEFQGNFNFRPVLNVSAAVTQPIYQNAPNVTLTVSNCEGGTINWKGSNNTSGSGTVIPVPTAAVGSLVYSATCTLGGCQSVPGSTTVSITSAPITGSFDGFVYGADCSTFRGWAWDRTKVNTPVSVDILDGPTVIAVLNADVFRQDLQTAGKGNGKHAFSWPIPENLKDGVAHNLTARISGSSFILKDSPKSLVCAGTGSSTNKPPVPPTPTILVTPLAAQVGVPFSGTLVAFTDPEGQPLTYALSSLPNGLSISASTRVISGTPTEAGTFVLAYSASDGVLTNSVSFPLTVNPASTTTVTGNFEGYLDKVECNSLRGWVWDRNKPNTPLTVEFYTDGTVWGSTPATIYRDDLKTAGKGNGAHAYNFTVPEALKSGVHLIRARVLGSTYELKSSGRYLPLPCPTATRLSAETGSGLSATVMGNPVSDRVEVEIKGAEGKPLRLQLTDASGRLVAERQIETAKTLEHQTLSVQSQPAGLLLLRVNSGLKSLTIKVLKQ